MTQFNGNFTPVGVFDVQMFVNYSPKGFIFKFYDHEDRVPNALYNWTHWGVLRRNFPFENLNTIPFSPMRNFHTLVALLT